MYISGASSRENQVSKSATKELDENQKLVRSVPENRRFDKRHQTNGPIPVTGLPRKPGGCTKLECGMHKQIKQKNTNFHRHNEATNDAIQKISVRQIKPHNRRDSKNPMVHLIYNLSIIKRTLFTPDDKVKNSHRHRRHAVVDGFQTKKHEQTSTTDPIESLGNIQSSAASDVYETHYSTEQHTNTQASVEFGVYDNIHSTVHTHESRPYDNQTEASYDHNYTGVISGTTQSILHGYIQGSNTFGFNDSANIYLQANGTMDTRVNETVEFWDNSTTPYNVNGILSRHIVRTIDMQRIDTVYINRNSTIGNKSHQIFDIRGVNSFNSVPTTIAAISAETPRQLTTQLIIPTQHQCVYNIFDIFSRTNYSCVSCNLIVNASISGVTVPVCYRAYCTVDACQYPNKYEISNSYCSCRSGCEHSGMCCYNYHALCLETVNTTAIANINIMRVSESGRGPSIQNITHSEPPKTYIITPTNLAQYKLEMERCSKSAKSSNYVRYIHHVQTNTNGAGSPLDVAIDYFRLYTTCNLVHLANGKTTRMNMISKCPVTVDHSLQRFKQLCETLHAENSTYTELFMTRSMVHYDQQLFRNIYCVLCHNIDLASVTHKFVHPGVHCQNRSEAWSQLATGSTQLVMYFQSRCEWFFDFTVSMPKTAELFRCSIAREYIDLCNNSYEHAMLNYHQIERACLSYKSELVDVRTLVPHGHVGLSTVYRNAHCGICNGIDDLSHLVCLPISLGHMSVRDDIDYISESLFILFDFFHILEPLELTIQSALDDTYICPADLLYDQLLKRCVRIKQDTGGQNNTSGKDNHNEQERYSNNSMLFCFNVSDQSQITHDDILNLMVKQTEKYLSASGVNCTWKRTEDSLKVFPFLSASYAPFYKLCISCLMGDISSKILHNVEAAVKSFRRVIYYVLQKYKMHNVYVSFCDNDDIYLCLTHLHCQHDEALLQSENATLYRQYDLKTHGYYNILVQYPGGMIIDHALTNFLLTWDSRKGSSGSFHDFARIVSSTCVSEIHVCPRLSFHASSVQLDGGVLVFHGRRHFVAGPGSFIFRGNTLVICAKYVSGPTQKVLFSGNDVVIQHILTLVSISVSVIGLVITIGTYLSFKQLRTFPGICLMNFSLALLLAQLLFAFSILVKNYPVVCLIFGVGQHMFWLSSFVWTLLFTYDAFKTFGCFPKTPKADKTFTLACFGLIGWGGPFVFTIILFLLDKYDVYNVGYGLHAKCWITSAKALIYTFLVPIGIILFVNIVLLVKTLITIQKTMNLSEAMNMTYSGRVRIGIYMRLTSIIGITWIFGFIANIPGLHYMVYPFIVFNGSQGVIVCVAFCSSRSIRDLCGSCWNKPTRQSTTGPTVGTAMPENNRV